MSALDDVRLVLLLACESGDRDDAEQRALLRVAIKLDNAANAQIVTNTRDGDAWRLVDVVLGTDSSFARVLPRSLVVAVEKAWLRADEWDRAHGLPVRADTNFWDDEADHYGWETEGPAS